MYLQKYDFDIVYRSGVQVAHVDFLSHNPVEYLTIGIIENEWIKVVQMQDPDIESIWKILESRKRSLDTKQYFEKYMLKDGVVFCKTEGFVMMVKVIHSGKDFG